MESVSPPITVPDYVYGSTSLRSQYGIGGVLAATVRKRGIMAIVIRLHRVDERDLVFGATPALVRPFAAQIGIIDLDAPGESLSLVELMHDLQELAGGVVAVPSSRDGYSSERTVLR